MLSRVRRSLIERSMIERGQVVLVGCSGGPDSAALLVAMARLAPEFGFEVQAASVDHGLRSDAAADVEAARTQAAALDVPFHGLDVLVSGQGSLQAEARRARYGALTALAQGIGAQRLAVGHTMDDQAETVVLRLLRGASVAGLSAIRPRRADGVIRPLIDCRRAQVHEFARRHCEQIANDPSNLDRRFDRVRVRDELLPSLQAEDASLVEHLSDLADDCRELWAMVGAAAAELLSEADEMSQDLPVAALKRAPAPVRREALRLWFAWLSKEPLGRSHLAQLEHCLAHGGEVWLPDGISVLGDQGQLHWVRRESSD